MLTYSRINLKAVLPFLAGAAFLLGGVQTFAADLKKAAPEWQSNDVDGKPVKLSDFKG
jgi:hypothetical protein